MPLYLVSVIDDNAGSATPAEMAAVPTCCANWLRLLQSLIVGLVHVESFVYAPTPRDSMAPNPTWSPRGGFLERDQCKGGANPIPAHGWSGSFPMQQAIFAGLGNLVVVRHQVGFKAGVLTRWTPVLQL